MKISDVIEHNGEYKFRGLSSFDAHADVSKNKTDWYLSFIEVSEKIGGKG